MRGARLGLCWGVGTGTDDCDGKERRTDDRC